MMNKTLLTTSILISSTLSGITFLIPGSCYRSPSRCQSSYPYISGDTFRSFCTHIIDETKIPFDPAAVKSGDTIFLKTDYVDFFFTSVAPHIIHPYILITHNSDHGITLNHKSYLEDSKLIAWFAQNTLIEHEKLIPIPIGLANKQWPHGNTRTVENTQKSMHTKTITLYLNYAIGTNVKERQAAYNILSDQPFSFIGHKKNFDGYLRDLALSQFVLSPPGNGLDCHRTWEALYMNAIPIVKRSAMDKVFAGLPVIIVDEWKEITEEYLQNVHEYSKHASYHLHKLYADYWFNLIKDIQNQWKNR